jgi:putative colanic acid biosynthesis acetyltransferase WcaF
MNEPHPISVSTMTEDSRTENIQSAAVRRADDRRVEDHIPDERSGEERRRAERRAGTVHHQFSAEQNPYLRPAFTLKNRLTRHLWGLVWLVFYRTSPVPLFAWRAALLRLFGAKLGKDCHFYPSGKIWAPWNLICEDTCTLANGAEIYNPSTFYMGSHAIISQQAFICGATHDYDDAAFPMISYPMKMGAYAWVCARASLAPGVQMGDGAVLGMGAVATRDLEPWGIYGGNPAVKAKSRKCVQSVAQDK